MIKQVVEAGNDAALVRRCPPRRARHRSQEQAQPVGQRSLAGQCRKSDLLGWIDGGQAGGGRKRRSRSRMRDQCWAIGKPDAVFEFPEPVPIKATGTMPYQNVIVETNLDEDKWVQAIEIQPGDRSVVHHMMVYLLAREKDASTQEEAADERAGFWASMCRATPTLIYPEGFAKPLAARSEAPLPGALHAPPARPRPIVSRSASFMPRSRRATKSVSSALAIRR